MNTASIKLLIQQSLAAIDPGEGIAVSDAGSRIGVFHTDASGVLDRVHHHFIDITGVRHAEVVGKVWLQTVFCDDRDRVCKEWYQSMIKNRLFTASFRIPDRTRGGLKKVSCSLVPEFSDFKQTIGYFGVFVEPGVFRQAV
jgi:PAS domain-containing protein